MNKTRIAIVLGALIVISGVGWWLYQRHVESTQQAAVASGAVPQPSALVKTEMINMQPMTDTLTVYADVMTGNVESVSFPRAGQVSRLLVVQGQRVKKGAALANLVTDPTTQLAYNQAVNAVNFAQGELRRNEDLFSLQLATLSQVDTARRSLHDAQANLAAQVKLGGDLGSATVTAPFEGVVTALSVAQGDRVQPGATILQMGHTDTLRVQLGIEPDTSRLVRVGMPVALVPVLDAKQKISASISQVHDLIDPKTQLINAVVILPAQSGNLLVPGMRVKGAITIGQHNAWTVPRQSVLTDAQGSYIFQVAQGVAHRVNVTKGTEAGGVVAISGTMDTKLPVVVLGNYVLQDGMKVREGAQ